MKWSIKLKENLGIFFTSFLFIVRWKMIAAAGNGSSKDVEKGEERKNGNLFSNKSFVSSVKEMVSSCNKRDTRRIIHSIKVGIALVLVSLLYLVDPMFEQVRENGMWAIMTVVVMFEFYAGATLSKGINRGVGTLLGGGTGCIAAILAAQVGGIAKPLIIATSLFIFGGGATYYRQVPKIKKKYDYGIMIFILTFNLVAVSGVRAEKVVGVARDRLAAIGMGFALCIVISFLISPIWSSNELHNSTASKFHKLATAIQGCLDEYFKVGSEKENQEADGSAYIQVCKSILTSKSNDESLANFAKWEPWHGKFGLHYPWDKYLEIGEHLRELATTILSLKGCLQSPKQPPPMKRQILKEPCENFMLSIGWILKELGEGIGKMETCQTKPSINPKLQSVKLQLSPRFSSYKMEVVETDENLVMSSFNFLLLEIVDKVEVLAKKVEELGEIANFPPTKMQV